MLLSKKYSIRNINEKDIGILYEICQSNPVYYQYLKEPLTLQKLRHDMTALPPNVRCLSHAIPHNLFAGLQSRTGARPLTNSPQHAIA
jgi:hypothetical protein